MGICWSSTIETPGPIIPVCVCLKIIWTCVIVLVDEITRNEIHFLLLLCKPQAYFEVCFNLAKQQQQKKNNKAWCGQTSPWVKLLLCKCGDLSLTLRITNIKIPGLVGCACDPRDTSQSSLICAQYYTRACANRHT